MSTCHTEEAGEPIDSKHRVDQQGKVHHLMKSVSETFEQTHELPDRSSLLWRDIIWGYTGDTSHIGLQVLFGPVLWQVHDAA